jgi:DNA-directed RNA polymerase subunit RPC12/RpoP
MPTTYDCDGCGAPLGSPDDLVVESTATGRSWYCRYCRMPVSGVIGERLSHREDGSPTDRRP